MKISFSKGAPVFGEGAPIVLVPYSTMASPSLQLPPKFWPVGKLS